MQDVLKLFAIGTVAIILYLSIVTGFILYNDQKADSSFGQLWQEHQQLP
jgi:Ni,Fe-hydrogenase I cytochrome b subunit